MFFQLIGHELLVYELKYSKKFSLTVCCNLDEVFSSLQYKYTDIKRHDMIYSNFLANKMRLRNNQAVQKIEKINGLFEKDAFI